MEAFAVTSLVVCGVPVGAWHEDGPEGLGGSFNRVCTDVCGGFYVSSFWNGKSDFDESSLSDAEGRRCMKVGVSIDAI
jgi:hypothetical protein